jgi:hypothetical protein
MFFQPGKSFLAFLIFVQLKPVISLPLSLTRLSQFDGFSGYFWGALVRVFGGFELILV